MIIIQDGSESAIESDERLLFSLVQDSQVRHTTYEIESGLKDHYES
jgi:hypothetical protein